MTMTKLYCPTCGVEIDEHEAGRCLDAWAGRAVLKYAYRMSESGLKIWIGEPEKYSDDISAAWMLEEKIDELKLRHEYLKYIGIPFFYRLSKPINTYDLWHYIHATPLERTRASIKAVSG